MLAAALALQHGMAERNSREMSSGPLIHIAGLSLVTLGCRCIAVFFSMNLIAPSFSMFCFAQFLQNLAVFCDTTGMAIVAATWMHVALNVLLMGRSRRLTQYGPVLLVLIVGCVFLFGAIALAVCQPYVDVLQIGLLVFGAWSACALLIVIVSAILVLRRMRKHARDMVGILPATDAAVRQGQLKHLLRLSIFSLSLTLAGAIFTFIAALLPLSAILSYHHAYFLGMFLPSCGQLLISGSLIFYHRRQDWKSQLMKEYEKKETNATMLTSSIIITSGDTMTATLEGYNSCTTTQGDGVSLSSFNASLGASDLSPAAGMTGIATRRMDVGCDTSSSSSVSIVAAPSSFTAHDDVVEVAVIDQAASEAQSTRDRSECDDSYDEFVKTSSDARREVADDESDSIFLLHLTL